MAECLDMLGVMVHLYSTDDWRRKVTHTKECVCTGSTIIYGQSQDTGVVLYNQGTCNVTVSHRNRDPLYGLTGTTSQNTLPRHQ